jgi:hypothetical protein
MLQESAFRGLCQFEPAQEVCYLDRDLANLHRKGDLTGQFLNPLGMDLYRRDRGQENDRPVQ